ncbi:DivIVA domain-containing protein [Micromonospora sp. NPDC007271]|uniref:DivIVA domain-containing protein n=1 Tax=Micromonospora sp. NPDC007271 TaxID=3154587 RepID=UPI0033EE46AB
MAHLTPADVRNAAFRKPPIGKRGYDEKDVDDFLDAVEQTITALTEEVTSLRAQLGNGTSSSGTGGQGVASTELEQIKNRLARLEAIVANAGLRPSIGDPLFGDGR